MTPTTTHGGVAAVVSVVLRAVRLAGVTRCRPLACQRRHPLMWASCGPVLTLISEAACGNPPPTRMVVLTATPTSGAAVVGVQKMLGHASGAMRLDVYADLFDDDLEAVANAMGEAGTQRDR